jgi:hypothetical protein
MAYELRVQVCESHVQSAVLPTSLCAAAASVMSMRQQKNGNRRINSFWSNADKISMDLFPPPKGAHWTRRHRRIYTCLSTNSKDMSNSNIHAVAAKPAAR